MAIEFRSVTPMLETRDVRATIEFYTTLLGFQVGALAPEQEPTLCILERGGVTVVFTVGLHSQGEPPKLTGQLSFEVSDAAALHGDLDGRVEVLWGPEVYGYGRREFSVRDPNGYALVFSEPTDDPPDCVEE